MTALPSLPRGGGAQPEQLHSGTARNIPGFKISSRTGGSFCSSYLVGFLVSFFFLLYCSELNWAHTTENRTWLVIITVFSQTGFQKHYGSKPIWWLFWTQRQSLPDFWCAGAALELLFGDKQKFPRQMSRAETWNTGTFWALVCSLQTKLCTTHRMGSGLRIKRYLWCSLLLTHGRFWALFSYPARLMTPTPPLWLVTSPEINLDEEVFLCEIWHKRLVILQWTACKRAGTACPMTAAASVGTCCCPVPLALHPAASWSHLLMRWEKSLYGQSG